MKIAALLAMALMPFAAQADLTDGTVADLKADTFDAFIKGSADESTLVEFFAPWCGHCKALTPEYDKAAEQLKGKHSIAKVDCTEQRDLCSTYGIKGFPTLKFVAKDGSTTDYEDARKTDALVKAVIKNAQPAFVVIDAAGLAAFQQGPSALKVVLTTASAESAAAAEIKKAAASLRKDADVAILVDAAAAADSVKLYRSFDEPELAYAGELTAAGVTAWAKSESLPLVGEIGPENFQKYVEKGLPLVWTFVDYNDKAQAADIPAALAPVAKQFKSNVVFAKLDGNRWGEHAKTFGLTGATPGLVIEDRKSRKNYIFPEGAAVTTEAFTKFVQDFTEGKLTANVKSAEPPASNDGPVTVVVGKTYDSLVVENDKDVFVEFYAPWCGHCKTLAPKWKELGEHFAADAGVTIAMVDGTENDTPIEIQGFPTLYFYPANDKKNPIPYNGERSTDALIKFVNEKRQSKATAAAAEEGKDEL